MKKGIIITLVILAAIGISVGFYYWFRKKPAPSTPAAPGTKADTTNNTAAVKPDKINTDAVKQPVMPQTAVEEIPETPFVLVRNDDLRNTTEVGLSEQFSTEVGAGFGRG